MNEEIGETLGKILKISGENKVIWNYMPLKFLDLVHVQVSVPVNRSDSLLFNRYGIRKDDLSEISYGICDTPLPKPPKIFSIHSISLEEITQELQGIRGLSYPLLIERFLENLKPFLGEYETDKAGVYSKIHEKTSDLKIELYK